ncbi:MAG: hypothetical protein WC823_02080 [Parcubacteria group bacterium]|jgi:capsular polysaccharide biosynthesis protein
MKKILNDRLFWIFFVLIAGSVFLMTTGGSKVYQAQSRILFLPKNEAAVRNIDQIIENARQIPLSLSFYNKIVELNGDIEDGALELPDAKRKEFWNAKIETRQVKKSGVLEIVIFDASQLQAEIIMQQTVAGILTVMGNYYDVQNGLNMRVIDGPITQEATRVNYAQTVGISLAGGILAGILITWLINFMVELFSSEAAEEKKSIARPGLFPKFSFPEVNMKKPFGGEGKKEKVFNFNLADEVALVQPIQPKKFSFFGSREKKSSAPSNLPVDEEFNFKLAGAEAVSMESVVPMEAPVAAAEEENEFVLDMGGAKKDASPIMLGANVDNKREATPEEVKMRLNKLLSGGN